MRPIDADAVIARFEGIKKRSGNSLLDVIFLDGAMSVVDAAPTLDCEPVRHAQWIRQDDTFTKFECGFCKAKNYDGFERYCPNCGAKMDGKENG